MALIDEAFAVDSAPGRVLRACAGEARCAVISGIPGVGKSLFVREQVLMARRLGRRVYSLEWDVARLVFDQPAILERYPEIDDVTHPVIRRAAGLWARQAVGQWFAAHADDRDFLVIEAPLIGGRFSELARVATDEAESFLAGNATRFLVPLPSVAVRNRIQALRSLEINQNRHALDAKNAPPALVDAIWLELMQVADATGVTRDARDTGYSPGIYWAVYERLLRHRHVTAVPVSEVVEWRGSPHATEGLVTQLAPLPADAARWIDTVEHTGIDATTSYVDNWYRM